MSLPTQYVASHSVPAISIGASLQPVNPPNNGGPTFREYLRVLRRHWRIVLVPLLIGLAGTALAMLLMTPMYTARCTIMIERQTPQILTIKQPVAENEDAAEEHDFYATQYELLASRSLAAQVIEELKLDKDPYFMKLVGKFRNARHNQSAEASNALSDNHEPFAFTPSRQTTIGSRLIDAYLAQLIIEPEPRTRLVRVAFTSPDPVLSARIVDAHVHTYITRGTQLRAQASRNAQEFLRVKLGELEKRVEESEAALNKYRQDRGIVGSPRGDKTEVVMGRIVDLSKALTLAETQRITLEAQESLAKDSDYKSLPAVQTSQVVQNLKAQQSAVDSEYESMASQYKPDYPPLAELAAKKRALSARLNDEMRRVAAGIEWKFRAAQEREGELRKEIEGEKHVAAALNQASLQDAVLAREVYSNQELYRSVLARMNELGMAAAISASNVSMVDEPEVPLAPSSPKKLLTLSLVGLFALFCGVSSAFFLDHFDDSFEDPEEIEDSLRLPSLGTVPDFQKLTQLEQGSLRRLSARLPHAALRAGKPPNEIADGMFSFAAAGEAYRAIRIGILLSRAEAPPKTILITSGSPKEGKTVTSINLAIAFAKMGSRVLLIDCDLRRPRCHDILGLGHRPGLTEVLTGSSTLEELVVPTGVDRLWCLTAGSHPPNPGELLGSAKMAYTILSLRNNYDFVIIDSAPVMTVTDTLPLTAIVDGVLLVVGPRTSKDFVRKACARLSQIRTNILGIVLNQTEASEHDYYYSRSSLEYVELSQGDQPGP